MNYVQLVVAALFLVGGETANITDGPSYGVTQNTISLPPKMNGKFTCRSVREHDDGRKVLRDCEMFQYGPVSTPTPTPTTVPIKCDGGELPKYPGSSFPNWFGYPRAKIFDGNTRTYCYTAKDSPWRVSLDVGDETDAAQCLWTETDFIPPAASGYPVEHQVGRDTSYVFFGAGSNLNGTWRIRVKVISENCSNVFHIVARS